MPNNFLIRAKAIAYDIDELMQDVRIFRNTLHEEQFQSEQENELWQTNRDLVSPEPEIIDNSDALRIYKYEYMILERMLNDISKVIVSETPDLEEPELPSFLPTGGEGA